MRYRIEYSIIGTENTGNGSKEFEAETDEEASSQVEGICQEAKAKINKGIKNQFWHFGVCFCRLVRIEQPEISVEIKIPPFAV